MIAGHDDSVLIASTVRLSEFHLLATGVRIKPQQMKNFGGYDFRSVRAKCHGGHCSVDTTETSAGFDVVYFSMGGRRKLFGMPHEAYQLSVGGKRDRTIEVKLPAFEIPVIWDEWLTESTEGRNILNDKRQTFECRRLLFFSDIGRANTILHFEVAIRVPDADVHACCG